MSGQEIYVIANSERGILLDGADTAPDVRAGNPFALAAAWPYRLQVYYIRNLPTPTLSRRVLTWDATAGAMAMTTEDLVPGVESLRFRFGVDTTGNGEGRSLYDRGGDDGDADVGCRRGGRGVASAARAR